ncbi:MAG: serine/threonine-protein phosphatase [Bacteroides sp.]|nr:serine/threonine-protein phosphatase [Bacteroides sp.]
MIRIRKPLCFTEIGRKDNQEDYLYPTNADATTKIFILCDGIGGHDNGEVASMTVANVLGNYLTSCSQIDIPTFETGLSKAYDALDSIDTNTAKKPGTTMTCLCINDDSYLVAHIGDSRVYHIRPSLFDKETGRGGILYQSSDHSLVNDLLKAGELTEEEARDFPQKNIITRAMQPHLQKRYKADVYLFDDIEEGDYFFLCCDGVLEQLSNENLCEILANSELNDKQKLIAIKEICDGKTRDNYTCWLVPVDKVTLNRVSNITQVIQAEEENQNIIVETGIKITNNSSTSPLTNILPNPNISIKKIILYIGALAIFIVLVWLLLRYMLK